MSDDDDVKKRYTNRCNNGERYAVMRVKGK